MFCCGEDQDNDEEEDMASSWLVWVQTQVRNPLKKKKDLLKKKEKKKKKIRRIQYKLELSLFNGLLSYTYILHIYYIHTFLHFLSSSLSLPYE